MQLATQSRPAAPQINNFRLVGTLPASGSHNPGRLNRRPGYHISLGCRFGLNTHPLLIGGDSLPPPLDVEPQAKISGPPGTLVVCSGSPEAYSLGVAQDQDNQPERKAEPPPKSFGNMGPDHWSRSRTEKNTESIEYYRERSRAPGVKEGGGLRNHYCMACDGVIPIDPPTDTCPHCGIKIEGKTRRYFNWVEIDSTPPSDLKLVGFLAMGATVLALLLWWLIR